MANTVVIRADTRQRKLQGKLKGIEVLLPRIQTIATCDIQVQTTTLSELKTIT